MIDSGEGNALVEQATALAEGALLERARAHDTAGTFPVENFADLHRAGLLALPVPAGSGGGDA
ncbi:MAG: acyl-CoA dehydrogenase family protein, partial [Acidobacteriota bacterium]|nr:acyl-CoA dehydrogenase family protein [Acidobacteriota bacterium]